MSASSKKSQSKLEDKPQIAALRKDLARSGLTLADAKVMQIELLTGDELDERTQSKTGSKKKREGVYCPGGGYVLPYFTPDGKRSDNFARIRLLGDDLPFRYWQAQKTAPRVYFPPVRAWAEISKDPAVPIIITEGEKKAYRACLEKGLNVLSLGGVWSFQSKRLGLSLLRDLEAIDWRERAVFICFDSDREDNEQVMLAEQRFAEELSRRGARVAIIRLTSASDGSKRGIDDFLEQESRKAFDKLLVDAQQYSDRFDELNRDFMVIESLADVLKLDTGKLYSYSKFKNVVGAKYSQHTMTENGPKDIDLVKPWLASANRNEVADMLFEPSQPFPIFFGSDSKRYYNRFRGFSVTPEDGDVTPFLELVEHVFANAPASDREWFIDWLAFKAQNPAGKLTSSVVITGKSGIGKSLIGELFGGSFKPYYSEIKNENLHEPFNADWLADKLFILGNEISAPDRRVDADRIKNMVTQEMNSINDKYGAKFAQKNYATYLLTSNYKDPLKIRADERRFYIHDSNALPLTDEQKARILGWRDKQNGVARLLGFMLKHKISKSFDPTAAARETEGKYMAVALGNTSMDNFAEEVLADPKARLGSDVEIWDMALLLKSFDPLGNYRDASRALASALANAGAWYTTKQVKTKNGPKRLWVVKNVERWKKEPGVVLAREYNRHAIGGKPRSFDASDSPTVASREKVASLDAARDAKRQTRGEQ
jgi:hypothetical protein